MLSQRELGAAALSAASHTWTVRLCAAVLRSRSCNRALTAGRHAGGVQMLRCPPRHRSWQPSSGRREHGWGHGIGRCAPWWCLPACCWPHQSTAPPGTHSRRRGWPCMQQNLLFLVAQRPTSKTQLTLMIIPQAASAADELVSYWFGVTPHQQDTADVDGHSTGSLCS